MGLPYPDGLPPVGWDTEGLRPRMGMPPPPLSEERSEPLANMSLPLPPEARPGLEPKGLLPRELPPLPPGTGRRADDEEELELSPPSSLDRGSLLWVRAEGSQSDELDDCRVDGRALSLGDLLVSMRKTSSEEMESLRARGAGSRLRSRRLDEPCCEKNAFDEVGGYLPVEAEEEEEEEVPVWYRDEEAVGGYRVDEAVLGALGSLRSEARSLLLLRSILL